MCFFCKYWCFYSVGIYCCGPCPVKAVREKRVDLLYDIPFIYAEVNADVYTAVVKNGKVLMWNVDTDRVGSLICTKCVDGSSPQDITKTYKKAKGRAKKLQWYCYRNSQVNGLAWLLTANLFNYLCR